ncbi:MAG: GGDEF domain-containing phosphodiesterase [Pseudomonadota bacterium]
MTLPQSSQTNLNNQQWMQELVRLQGIRMQDWEELKPWFAELAKVLETVAENSGLATEADIPAHLWEESSRLLAAFCHWISRQGFSLTALSNLLNAWLMQYERGLRVSSVACIFSQAINNSTKLPEKQQFTAFLMCTLISSVLMEGALRYERLQADEIATYDADTGLPNLEGLVIRLQSTINNSLVQDKMVAVICVDLKADRLGLSSESETMKHFWEEVLKRMSDLLRPADIVSRLNRFELALMLPDLQLESQALMAASKITQIFDDNFVVSGHSMSVRPQVGIALAPDHTTSPSTLVRYAQMASKSPHSDNEQFLIFSPSMERQLKKDSVLESQFLEALRDNEFQLFYQPQIDTKTGRCTTAEALLRWQTKTGEWVPPPLTIEIAERTGNGPAMTRLLLNTACRQANEFARNGVRIGVSVNLTAADIRNPDLPDLVQQALSTWRLQPDMLTLELTEGSMVEQEDRSMNALHKLRSIGAKIAVDDFGTGYSSMTYLKTMPLSELKVDQTFVNKITSVTQDRLIVKSMIDLAHALNLEVVAEGAEDRDTVLLLRDYGCDKIQGYFYSKPLPAPRFIEWCQQRELALRR